MLALNHRSRATPLALLLAALSLIQVVASQAFNASDVSPSTRQSWCLAQITLCPKVCESANTNVTSPENTCQPSTLDYTCTCTNGFTPDMARYAQSLPYFICMQVTENCIAAHPNDLQGQNSCEQEQATFCGSSDVVSVVYKVTATQTDGSVATENVTLGIVQPVAATTSSISSIASSSAKGTATTSSAVAVQTSSTPAPTTSAPLVTTGSSKSGLSSGALAAAIAVPIVGVAVIAAAVGFLLYQRRQKKRPHSDQRDGWGKSELPADSAPVKLPNEMPVEPRYELHGDAMPREMAANEQPALEAGVASPR